MKKLKLKYHPVEQKIILEKWNPTTEWEPLDYQVKETYLQQLPVNFFEQWFTKLHETSEIQLSFVGTEMDYKDLKKMIDFYNGCHSETKYSLLDCYEQLPSVDNCYKKIKNTSNSILSQLQNDIESEKEDKIKNDFLELRNAVEAATKEEEKPINLCFVGSYSTGKSSLINSLLGVEILPKADAAKTAKIFSIVNNTVKSLNIKYLSDSSILTLDILDTNGKLEIDDSYNNDFTKEIRDFVSKQNDVTIEKSIYALLDYLNELEAVVEIILNYPISFMGDTKCVIYDTPGTDSDNSDQHEEVLKRILEDQKNSILFIVFSPKKMEGRGTKVVFEKIMEAENAASNNNGINISLERCFYVYNMADDMDPDEFDNGIESKKLPIPSVQEDGLNESIMFKGHRIFLTSPRWGLAASDKSTIPETRKEKYLTASLDMPLYTRNISIHEAESNEYIAYCKSEYGKNGITDNQKLFINSGVFILQKAIHDYVNKYSTGIHAHRFFTDISTPIKNFSSQVKTLENNLQCDIETLKQNEEKLKTQVSDQLDNCLSKFINEDIFKYDETEIKSYKISSEEIEKFIYDKIKNNKWTWITGKNKIYDKVGTLQNEISIKVKNIINEVSQEVQKTRNDFKIKFRKNIIECLKNQGLSDYQIDAYTAEKKLIQTKSPKVNTFIWSWVGKENREEYKEALKTDSTALLYNEWDKAFPKNIKVLLEDDATDFIKRIKENITEESSSIKECIENKTEKENEYQKKLKVSALLDTYIETLNKELWEKES